MAQGKSQSSLMDFIGGGEKKINNKKKKIKIAWYNNHVVAAL